MAGVRTLALCVLLAGSAGLSGCSKADPTSPVLQSLQLSQAEDRWKAAGLQNYAFTVTVSCFCAPEYSGPLRVKVVAGRVATVTNLSRGSTLSVTTSQTIEELFALVRREAAVRPTELSVLYDGIYGFPASIRYGNLAVDAGAVITITDFTPGG